MKRIISNKVGSIIKEKEKLEEALNIKLSNRGRELFIDGLPLEEYEAEKVIEAINFGFKTEIALMIKEKELTLEILSIKDFTKRKDMKEVRGRVIGTKGKTLRTLSELTDCFFEVRNNDVGIIGSPEKMKTAQEALTSLIRGSKQSSVYKYLEKRHPKPVLDLGLK
ncbi:MAG: KH domain-containing protein [Candidatus Nanoarchaeia archaeon]